MKKYIVIGLESTGTRIVSQMIANNLEIIEDISEWDPYNSDDVLNDYYLVTHKSLPHSERDNYISLEEIDQYDYIIITTRDWSCSLVSKLENHQPDPASAIDEHKVGASIMRQITDFLSHKVYIFSIESAVILQDVYIEYFLKQLDIKLNHRVDFYDLNKKYIWKVDKITHEC